jgi:hypothetical protein
LNQYLKGQTLTLGQGEQEQLPPSHFLLDAKLQKLGDKDELPPSVFLFEILSCKDPWMGGE